MNWRTAPKADTRAIRFHFTHVQALRGAGRRSPSRGAGWSWCLESKLTVQGLNETMSLKVSDYRSLSCKLKGSHLCRLCSESAGGAQAEANGGAGSKPQAFGHPQPEGLHPGSLPRSRGGQRGGRGQHRHRHARLWFSGCLFRLKGMGFRSIGCACRAASLAQGGFSEGEGAASAQIHPSSSQQHVLMLSASSIPHLVTPGDAHHRCLQRPAWPDISRLATGLRPDTHREVPCDHASP